MKGGLLQPIRVGEPFEIIGIDTCGPLRRTDDGHISIIVATDYCTEYALVESLRDETAISVARFLIDKVILVHDAPSRILSDHRKAFRFTVISKLCVQLQTRHIFSTHYHPQINGLVERMNKTLAIMLGMYVGLGHDDWHNY